MQIATTSRILGLLLMLLSLTFVPPLMVEQWYQDGYLLPYFIPFTFTLGIGFLLWFISKDHKTALRTHDGFLIVVLFWLTACFVGALPLCLTFVPKLSFTDAFFESVSGFTTTGATILTNLDQLPHSILYYRQQLQFLGGISIILLAVAIIPTLGIGGMQLFRTEISGPVKDDKLTPRITQTAKVIWGVYVTLIGLCALSYWLAGMSLFDAIGHSFSTVSTGGFSTHDESFGYFSSPNIKLIAIVFMFIGAINFNLHFLVFKRKMFRVYFQDPELRFFTRLFIYSIAIVLIALLVYGAHKHSPILAFDAFFEICSLLTTTGFNATNIPFPGFIPIMLLFLGIIGGCSGSTAGGLKAVRVLLLQKQGTREIRRLIHPHGQYAVKLGDKPIGPRVIEAIWGFFAIYFVVFILLLLMLLAVEEDFYSVFTALVATLSNSGRGLGNVAVNFSSLSDYAKWILNFAMLAGRLEIFTILVLFSPTFWRR
ncbi:MAG: potassium transporter [Gammaproteobacteria bacterium 39-13]|nr:potassium transporter [Gammaproteobacteria bacterium]OJV90724.1 MAG: potassium transporter [Gammaproteobacteria bacterium 39-13]